ncbi:MAG: guanosine monophosphate reductase [Ignavibacteriales bacterium]|mgnify:CR=1 FL=1|jgi:IMP dehydrogenase|nr:guanosine monophosphate reductase [Ignavibacteriaceae bacterium]NLH61383.1 guanosine monophosphate reductase [Ignavibacteriales bacterium]HOJ17085.1 guanosine monophosphate reductase [Ignavibacteriaceae bacterium]HPO56543.1 guanosine monophosphate reductase [Ignavibacteriaceae bacterium]
MKIYTKEELNNYSQSLTYDDISLVPTEVSRIKSRSEASTNSEFLGIKLSVPVVSSPMDSVTGIEMAQELSNLGCLGILNRFDSSLEEVLRGRVSGGIKAVSIGLTTEDDLIDKLVEKGFILCIDTANANNHEVLKKTESVKKKYNIPLIVGNIASGATLHQLEDAGADAVRVGIGSGSVCSTSIQTGIGIGQVSSILDVLFTRDEKKLKIKIIADGGIKSAGDVAKAMALGSDAVMLGRMLAGTKETPGEVIKYTGQLYKKYRGSASYAVKMKNEFIEGEETMIGYKGAVKNVVNSISDGLKSAMSYMNCYNLEELSSKNSFAVLSNYSYLERLPKA